MIARYHWLCAQCACAGAINFDREPSDAIIAYDVRCAHDRRHQVGPGCTPALERIRVWSEGRCASTVAELVRRAEREGTS